MKLTSRSKHADRVVLVRSDDSGLAMGRHLMAEGASVFAMGPIGELRKVGAFAREKLAEREEATTLYRVLFLNGFFQNLKYLVLVHWRQEKTGHSAALISLSG